MKTTLAATTLALGLLSCASAPPPLRQSPVAALQDSGGGDPGLILLGHVVTLDDADTTIPRGRIWVRGGRIAAVLPPDAALPAAAAGARVVDTGGVIYPGLIDLHNHPDYAAYPALPVQRAFADRYEWRFYDETYRRRISGPHLLLSSPDYFDLATDLGRYGEMMALAGGTTTLQGGGGSGRASRLSVAIGSRHFGPHAVGNCLARNVETESGLGTAASHVDMGRDALEWQTMRETAARQPLILHLAEGISSRMGGEFDAIERSGLLTKQLVVVHGTGLAASHFEKMRKAGASLVWSPLSNYLLYGKTADIKAARETNLLISLAPDWAPSGSKSLLGELKIAEAALRNLVGEGDYARELVWMATRNPARTLGWESALGQIREGFLADLVVIDARDPDVHRNLVQAPESAVRATIVRGHGLYGDRALLTALRGTADDLDTIATLRGGRAKALAGNCPGTALPVSRVDAVVARLAEAMQFDPAGLLARMKSEHLANELSRCTGAPRSSKAPGLDEAQRLVACRLGANPQLLSPAGLLAASDDRYRNDLLVNPNLPDFLKHVIRRMAD